MVRGGQTFEGRLEFRIRLFPRIEGHRTRETSVRCFHSTTWKCQKVDVAGVLAQHIHGQRKFLMRYKV